MPTFPALLTALSITFMVFGLYLLSRILPNLEAETWRDRPPLLFRLIRPLVVLLAPRAARNTPTEQLNTVRDKLHSAGQGYTLRPEEFLVTRRIGLGIGALLFGYVYVMLDLSTITLIAFAVLIPIGYIYPDVWLRDCVKRRHSRIEKEFPFFLELLVLTMRAGLNFSSALSHSVQRMPDGAVKSEFTHFLRDTRTGMSRRDALEALGRRVDQGAVSNFVAAVNQTEALGGEMGGMLIKQAAQRRAERFARAEKEANQAPVKMLLPLTAFLFPITIIIVLFPLAITARDSGALDFFFK